MPSSDFFDTLGGPNCMGPNYGCACPPDECCSEQDKRYVQHSVALSEPLYRDGTDPLD